MNQPINVFWFRRDLRLNDNTGLEAALKAGLPVLPIFIFDREILDRLPPKDARVVFIHNTLIDLQRELIALGSSLYIGYGKPLTVWQELLTHFTVKQVFANRDYEPYAKERDTTVKQFLQTKGVTFHSYKDHVIFDRTDEIVSGQGTPFKVFTPYKNVWMARLAPTDLASRPSDQSKDTFLKVSTPYPIPTLESMGFERFEPLLPPLKIQKELLMEYGERRNFPAEHSTSRLGLHLRFGTLSVRLLARAARVTSTVFLSELIWRDFYASVIDYFPHAATGPFREEYARIPWRDDEQGFQRWCAGQTGYPIVDAGMRELNETGFMHNRVRMIVASFLTKHLLINWQWGEAYFAEKLLDFDLASNNGGWQWAAGSGVDAAPYFRIFNPTEQTRKFDPELKYVRQWVPEFESLNYPKPIIDHKFARERALETYKKALTNT